jgi:CheY-like chemotaxis protein
MEICCPRCGNLAVPAGHEDARAFYQCQKCDRVWMTFLTPSVIETALPTSKVLVVDDSDELLGLIGAWLQDEGYILFTASSGSQALDIAQSHDPDVVLLDVVIPPPDGCTVCESLQQRQHPPEIILMTGSSDPAHLRRVDEFRGLTLLRKPFSSEAMLQSVRQAALRRTATISASPEAAGGRTLGFPSRLPPSSADRH